MKHVLHVAAVMLLGIVNGALAGEPPALSVMADGIGKDGYIDPAFAFCIPAAEEHAKEGPDKSIGLAWTAGPKGTRSYAVIAVDPDVPTMFSDAGKEGKTLSASMPRKNFYHWVLFDIPGDTRGIPAAMDSQAIVKKGKSVLKTPYGIRGVNDYAGYFAAQPDRKGIYAGYDGPCPPWNDERIHHYHFKVYALDIKSLKLSGQVTGPQLENALIGHVLAQGEAVGAYTLNPGLRK